MTDYDDKDDSVGADYMNRLETDDDDGNDQNPEVDDMDADDDIDDDDDDDDEIETPNELLDESGRDDDDDDDEIEIHAQDDDVDNDDDVPDNKHDTTTTAVAGDTSSPVGRIGTATPPTTSEKKHPRSKGGGMKGSRGGGGGGGGSSGRKKQNFNNTNRSPSVLGLTIPFRTIKKSMKLDPDIPIVQNEAAIMATVAVELFLKRLVTQSHRNAKNRGRNTVRYEDVAEARSNDKALAFLEPLLP